MPVLLYIDKLKKDGSEMQAEAERQNCEAPFRDLKEKHISELRAKLQSLEQQEKYYSMRELQFHLDTDSVLMYIQGLGRLRLKRTMDQFQVIQTHVTVLINGTIHVILSQLGIKNEFIQTSLCQI